MKKQQGQLIAAGRYRYRGTAIKKVCPWVNQDWDADAKKRYGAETGRYPGTIRSPRSSTGYPYPGGRRGPVLFFGWLRRLPVLPVSSEITEEMNQIFTGYSL